MNEAVAFHVEPGLVPVSASVISIDDLFRTIDHIENDPNPKWSKTHRCVAIGQLIIMFLGGLRRMEGLGLDVEDFMPGSLMEIFVRPNDHRELKTSNSERRVLLYAFAHPFPELLDKVLDLYEEAKCQGGDFSCGISEDVIVPLIHDTLKSTTGDDNCHLHNLRHSAAHWMFLRLSLSGFDKIPLLFPHLPKTTLWLNESKGFREILFQNGIVTNDDAWAISVALGHSNPYKVSIPSYVHCLDLLTFLFLRFRSTWGQEIDEEDLRKISGLPRSTAYVRLPALQSDADDDAKREHQVKRYNFAREVFRERLGLPLAVRTPSSGCIRPKLAWTEITRGVLWMSEQLSSPVDRIAATFGIPLVLVASISRKASDVEKTSDELPRVRVNRRSFDRTAHDNPNLNPPKGDLGSEFVSIYADALERYVSERRADTCDTLDYIYHHLLPRSARIAFTDCGTSATLKACMKLLKGIGLSESDLKVWTCDGSVRPRPSREWLKKWGLSWRYRVENQSGPVRILHIPGPWLVIDPCFASKENTTVNSVRIRALVHVLKTGAIYFNQNIAAGTM